MVINIFVRENTYGITRNTVKTKIPAGINEVELKATLRDLGFIPSDLMSYRATRVYLEENDSEKEICIDEFRSVEELGIKEDSTITIKMPHREPPRPSAPSYSRYPTISMRCLYGCPMAASVEDAVNEAEKYNHNDSIITEENV